MNRYQKLASNTVILAIGTFGSKLLVFLLMPLYTYMPYDRIFCIHEIDMHFHTPIR